MFHRGPVIYSLYPTLGVSQERSYNMQFDEKCMLSSGEEECIVMKEIGNAMYTLKIITKKY